MLHCSTDFYQKSHVLATCRQQLRQRGIVTSLDQASCLAALLSRIPLLLMEQYLYEKVRKQYSVATHIFFFFLFIYTASVMFDYYCRDSELSYIGGIGFQSTPPLEGAGVFNVPEGDSPQNMEPPFIA